THLLVGIERGLHQCCDLLRSLTRIAEGLKSDRTLVRIFRGFGNPEYVCFDTANLITKLQLFASQDRVVLCQRISFGIILTGSPCQYSFEHHVVDLGCEIQKTLRKPDGTRRCFVVSNRVERLAWQANVNEHPALRVTANSCDVGRILTNDALDRFFY